MGRTLTKNVIGSPDADPSPVRMCVVGAEGRLGAAIVRLAEREGCEVTRAIGREAESVEMRERGFDVVVDASTNEGVQCACRIAEAHEMPLLECVTGLDEPAKTALKALESSIPVLIASNTSLGIAAVRSMLDTASRALEGWTVSIEETHHVGKVDRPSGTARTIASDLRSAGRSIDDRDIVSNREGDVIGAHEITFTNEGERITLRHRALDRSIFAIGAIRAAKWLAAGRPAGRYEISDTLEPAAPDRDLSD